ncbi:hypothetical protein [Paenibacillus sp.]|uniref:hypothetical protein n=1 Tax=Paenibacillus sp. TaxID=58172 RepID=UPI0028109FAF|nr:hypothetical protein [Paenibacillus sp.]
MYKLIGKDHTNAIHMRDDLLKKAANSARQAGKNKNKNVRKKTSDSNRSPEYGLKKVRLSQRMIVAVEANPPMILPMFTLIPILSSQLYHKMITEAALNPVGNGGSTQPELRTPLQ